MDQAAALGLFFTRLVWLDYIEGRLYTETKHTNEVLEYGREDNSRKITTD